MALLQVPGLLYSAPRAGCSSGEMGLGHKFHNKGT